MQISCVSHCSACGLHTGPGINDYFDSVRALHRKTLQRRPFPRKRRFEVWECQQRGGCESRFKGFEGRVGFLGTFELRLRRSCCVKRGGDTGEVSNEATILFGETEEATGRSKIVGNRGVTNSLDLFRVGFETIGREDMSKKFHRIGTKGAFIHTELHSVRTSEGAGKRLVDAQHGP